MTTIKYSQIDTELAQLLEEGCPGCGGDADNGFDRGVPHSPYYCTKCEELLDEEIRQGLEERYG